MSISIISAMSCRRRPRRYAHRTRLAIGGTRGGPRSPSCVRLKLHTSAFCTVLCVARVVGRTTTPPPPTTAQRTHLVLLFKTGGTPSCTVRLSTYLSMDAHRVEEVSKIRDAPRWPGECIRSSNHHGAAGFTATAAAAAALAFCSDSNATIARAADLCHAAAQAWGRIWDWDRLCRRHNCRCKVDRGVACTTMRLVVGDGSNHCDKWYGR